MIMMKLKKKLKELEESFLGTIWYTRGQQPEFQSKLYFQPWALDRD